MIITYLFFIFAAVILAAFFSGSETAFTSIKFMKLVNLVEKQDKRALLVHRIISRPDKLLATTLIGTNVSVVLASALATDLFMRFNPSTASLMATILIVPLVLVFGEIIPKTICQNKSNQASMIVAPLLFFVQNMLRPIIAVVSAITNFLLELIGPRIVKKNPFLTKEEIKLIVRDVAKEGALEDYERQVIGRIFDFTLTKAADIMVGLNKVARLSHSQTKEEILRHAQNFGFTRFPVFDSGTLKGVLNIFDVFYNPEDNQWQKFIRPIRMVSFNDRLDVVFSVMQPNKETMVAVMKENKCVGILTMEDLIEEIVYRTTPHQIQNME